MSDNQLSESAPAPQGESTVDLVQAFEDAICKANYRRTDTALAYLSRTRTALQAEVTRLREALEGAANISMAALMQASRGASADAKAFERIFAVSQDALAQSPTTTEIK